MRRVVARVLWNIGLGGLAERIDFELTVRLRIESQIVRPETRIGGAIYLNGKPVLM